VRRIWTCFFPSFELFFAIIGHPLEDSCASFFYSPLSFSLLPIVFHHHPWCLFSSSTFNSPPPHFLADYSTIAPTDSESRLLCKVTPFFQPRCSHVFSFPPSSFFWSLTVQGSSEDLAHLPQNCCFQEDDFSPSRVLLFLCVRDFSLLVFFFLQCLHFLHPDFSVV